VGVDSKTKIIHTAVATVANSPSPTGSEQIPPGFIPAASGKMGSGEVERRENAMAQQKSVVDACSIGV